jgi:hypothetical protein
MHRAEGAKGGFGAAIYPTVGFHQVNRLFKLFTRELGKPFRYLRRLKRKTVNPLADGLLPPRYPTPAKRAIAVKDEQRLFRRSRNSHGLVHVLCCSLKGGARSKEVNRKVRTERGSVTRSGRGRLGVIGKDKRGLMFGRAAAHRAAVRTCCPRVMQAMKPAG